MPHAFGSFSFWDADAVAQAEPRRIREVAVQLSKGEHVLADFCARNCVLQVLQQLLARSDLYLIWDDARAPLSLKSCGTGSASFSGSSSPASANASCRLLSAYCSPPAARRHAALNFGICSTVTGGLIAAGRRSARPLS